MKPTFKIAVIQIRTELEKAVTMEKAEHMVREAAQNGAKVVVLPEMFNCPYAKGYFRRYADTADSGSVLEMSRWAKENGIILVGGSIPELDGEQLYNTCFVFNEQGEVIARHRKMHLFDVDIEGGVRFMESHNFAAGNEITVFDTGLGRMGVLICFDMRFPELVRTMAKRGAELIFCPAQFNMTTGPKHWELTIRARAMDNEIYYVGASAARYEGFSYEAWGHSTVAGPFGMIEATCDEKEQILYCDIDLNEVDSVRRQLPTFLKLREDMYTVPQ
ncbi:MAG: carbon-nitrogen hydrolase family protein [Oscillospiraceae bacterium]|nr:carbon-nitrogen hydrolase family protein [Oscillospiraceae bacterium]